jgi:hypothetical protein
MRWILMSVVVSSLHVRWRHLVHVLIGMTSGRRAIGTLLLRIITFGLALLPIPGSSLGRSLGRWDFSAGHKPGDSSSARGSALFVGSWLDEIDVDRFSLAPPHARMLGVLGVAVQIHFVSPFARLHTIRMGYI